MNIRITGHARGLGRSLYEYFKSLGHNVEGYSLSTGYDINTVEGREQILDGLDNVDVFVNNAWSEYSGQTKLLEEADKMNLVYKNGMGMLIWQAAPAFNLFFLENDIDNFEEQQLEQIEKSVSDKEDTVKVDEEKMIEKLGLGINEDPKVEDKKPDAVNDSEDDMMDKALDKFFT